LVDAEAAVGQNHYVKCGMFTTLATWSKEETNPVDDFLRKRNYHVSVGDF